MSAEELFRDATAGLVPSLADTLAAVERFQRRYVAFVSEEQSATTTLHVAHAHAIEAADATPYMNASSAEKRSGKTRFLEVYELLVPEPIRGSSMSPSVLFRLLDSKRRTLLLDEVDAIFSPKSDREELRGLLNAGYRRGSPAWRIAKIGKDFVPTPYDAFGVKVLAGIGKLPDTISDRCIPLELRRRRRDEVIERFRYRDARAEADPIRQALAAWASPETVKALRAMRPVLPDLDDDRALEGWEPLLAIADMAGESWPDRARAACLILHGDQSLPDDSTGVLTLAAIRDIFDRLDVDRVSTDELLDELAGRDDGPWALTFDDVGKHDRHGSPIPARRSARKLARILEPFGIKPDSIKTEDGRKVRGYLRQWFGEAWFRYLSSGPPGMWLPVAERGHPWADGGTAHGEPHGNTDNHTRREHDENGCVRCTRYGSDHTGGHLKAWKDVGP